jgi:predicted thioesterase
MTLEVGMSAEIRHVVQEEDTAAHYGSGLVPVLSTPHLVALMENAAHALCLPHLREGESVVGTRIDLRHLAATPVGMEVRVRAELVEIDGPRLRFHIEAWDEVERIGVCEHERFILDEARFMRRMEKKQRGEL